MRPVPKRTRPLQVRQVGHDGAALTGAAAEAEAEMAALAHDVVGGGGVARRDPAGDARRNDRLAAGVRSLRTGGTLKLGERTLMVLGGILAPLGLVIVLVGWNGAANTANLYEQIPYAISGGLFGLGIAFLGAFCYFAHWLTELVKENRRQSAAVVEALGRLEDVMRAVGTAGVVAGPGALTAGHAPPADGAAPAPAGLGLVATGKGTMAHRPECVVVAGKDDVRPVLAGESLAPCKLCDPYAVATN
jgi:hypothetical protein